MNENGSNEWPVVVDNLSRRFWRKQALDSISFQIPRGLVFGLVGENGAGKTTLIKHLMGMMQAKSGSVRVFGCDPVREPEKVLARVGYLSENRDLPNWMRVREVILFTQAFFPDWDAAYADELLGLFGLDPLAKIRHLSRGERAQLGLLLALAHRPELLILDEPSAGLDAAVRKDILAAVIRTVADEGRTVLFSSHLLDEVEYVADHVAFLHDGQLVSSAPLAELKAQYRLFTLHFDEPPIQPPAIENALTCEGAGLEWTFLTQGVPDAAYHVASQLGAHVVDDGEPSLEEIFVARVRGKRKKMMLASASVSQEN